MKRKGSFGLDMWDLMIVRLFLQECKFSISQVCVGVVIIMSLVLAFDLSEMCLGILFLNSNVVGWQVSWDLRFAQHSNMSKDKDGKDFIL